jgi:uncharacterized membrane protein
VANIDILIIGLVGFFIIHSVSIVNEPWRDRMVAKIGEWPWKGLYSMVSIAAFVLIVWGYGLARQEPLVLYTSPHWLRHVTLLLMVPVFPLLLATYLPGYIQRHTKHPMLAATLLWGFAHLLVNGTLADLLLFGGFLLWALTDRLSMRRRRQRPLPFTLKAKTNDATAVIIGLLIYAGFVFWLHGRLIGVPLLRHTT